LVGLFAFDVQLPRDPQFAYARERFKHEAEKWSQSDEQKLPRKVKPQIQKYPTYLRLLDFEEIGTPDNEIGGHLFPDKSGETLRDMINKSSLAARRCQKDYLLIALHSPATS
jgi:hypothetical protein